MKRDVTKILEFPVALIQRVNESDFSVIPSKIPPCLLSIEALVKVAGVLTGVIMSLDDELRGKFM